MERSPLCAAVQYVSVIRAEADPNEDETRAPGSRRRILWCFCLVRCCSSVTGEDPHSSFTHLFFLLVITSTCRLRLERINKVTHQMHVAARSVDWIRRNYTENAASCVCVCKWGNTLPWNSLESWRLLLWWREKGNFPSNRHKDTGKSGSITCMRSAGKTPPRPESGTMNEKAGTAGGPAENRRLFCSRRREVAPTSMMDAAMAFNKYSSRRNIGILKGHILSLYDLYLKRKKGVKV